MQQDATRRGSGSSEARFSKYGIRLKALLHSRGAWGLADQAVVSLGNYLTGLVLLQALPKAEFGAFFLLFSVMLFFNNIHNAIITYPLSLCGATSKLDELRRRAGSAALLTMMLALPLGLILALILVQKGRYSLIPWAVLAMCLWQLQETLRRGIMAHLRHREALLGDAASYLGQAAIIFVLARNGALTLEAAFIAITVTSFAGLLIQAVQLLPSIRHGGQIGRTMREHWVVGRWILLTSAITLFTVQATPWALGYFHGMGEVAEFGVLAQTMGLTNPVLIGIAGLIVPAAAAAKHRGVSAARHVTLMYSLQAAVILLPYYLSVLLAPEAAIRFFTAKDEYAGLGLQLQLYALGYLIVIPAQIVQALLSGLGRVRSTLAAQSAYSAATLVITLPLAAIYGLTGAVWGGLLPGVIFIIASMLLLRRASAAAAHHAAAGHGPGCAMGTPRAATAAALQGEPS